MSSCKNIKTSNRKTMKIYTWESIHNLDASTAFELVYGFKPNVEFPINSDKVIKNKANARCWWETASPQTQCNNVISPFIKDTTECYICGFKLEESGIDKSNYTTTPECEHILPVYKAAMYLHLYNTDYKDIIQKYKNIKMSKSASDFMIYNEINMEYAWAHKCCNQIKSDCDFIKFNERKQIFELDYKVTNSILTQIVEDSLSGNNGKCLEKKLKQNFLKMIKGTKKQQQEIISAWTSERVDILNAQGKHGWVNTGKVRRIIDYLNTQISTNKSMFTLISLCNLISASNMNDVYTIWNKYSPTTPSNIANKQNVPDKAPPVEKITKATIIMELTADATNMSNFNWNKTSSFVFNWYKNAFNIPYGINIDIRRSGKNKDTSKAILGSIINTNKKSPGINDFFRNFYATITYPNINDNEVLFPNEDGKINASIMVGQAYYILLLGNMINNMEKMLNTIPSTEKQPFESFYKRFINKYDEKITKLIRMKIDINTYYLFLMLFIFFVNDINHELINLLIDKLYEKDDSIIQIFNIELNTIKTENPIYKRFEKYTSQEIPTNNKLSNVQYSVVEFYVDAKSYTEWNPELIQVDELGIPDTPETTDSKGISVGVSGLIKLQDEIKILEDNYGFMNYATTEDDKKYIDALLINTIKSIKNNVEMININNICLQLNNGLCNNIISKFTDNKFQDVSQLLYVDDITFGEITIAIYKQYYIQIINKLRVNLPFSNEIIKSFLLNYDMNNNLSNPVNDYNINEKLNSLNNSDLYDIILTINETNEYLEGIEMLSAPSSSSGGKSRKGRKSKRKTKTRKIKRYTKK